MRHTACLFGIGLVLASCQVAPAVQSDTKATLPVPVPLQLELRGPGALAGTDGLIRNGTGRIVAAGGGNVVSNDGAGLAAKPEEEKHEDALVIDAQAWLEKPDGTRVGAAATSNGAGVVTLVRPLPATPMIARANFTLGDVTYQVAAIVRDATGPIRVDPAATMIAATAGPALRLRPDAAILQDASLARIWATCRHWGLTARPEDLALTANAAEALVDYWHEEVEEHVTDPSDRAALEGFARDVALLSAP